MSKDICVTIKETYGPPCFIDESGEPNCEYEVTECGMDLTGVPKNATTERLFQAASRTGSDHVLSDDDIESQVTAELRGFIEPREQHRVIKESIDRFKKDAKELLEKLGQKSQSVSPPIDCTGVPFGTNVFCDLVNYGMTLFDSCEGRRCSDYNYKE